MEIRDEDVAGLQSALGSHARIDASGALMVFVSPSREQPKDQGAVADACERRVVGKTPDDEMDDLSYRSDAAVDGRHAGFYYR